MAVDLLSGVDSKFLVKRFHVQREIKIGVDACGSVFSGGHLMHTARDAQPTLAAIERGDTIPARKMHNRETLVRNLIKNVNEEMLPPEGCKRSFLHAANDFLKRIRAADSCKVFVEQQICRGE